MDISKPPPGYHGFAWLFDGMPISEFWWDIVVRNLGLEGAIKLRDKTFAEWEELKIKAWKDYFADTGGKEKP